MFGKLWIGKNLFGELEPIFVLLLFVAFLKNEGKRYSPRQPNRVDVVRRSRQCRLSFYFCRRCLGEGVPQRKTCSADAPGIKIVRD